MVDDTGHIEIMPVESAEPIAAVARLAREIWTEHYVPIIGQAQVDYMLEHFQSVGAIGEQIDKGVEYFLAAFKDNPGAACLPLQADVPAASPEQAGGAGMAPEKAVGYLALVPDAAASELMISKIYVANSARGRGVGKAMLAFAENAARCGKCRKLWLTVNKHNANSIAFYERMGFENAGPIATDIGGGFVMDDFRMEKRLES